jgi:hypothetical protein
MRDRAERRHAAGGLRPRVIPMFVDVDRSPAEVITVYRTSKIDKSWRSES